MRVRTQDVQISRDSSTASVNSSHLKGTLEANATTEHKYGRNDRGHANFRHTQIKSAVGRSKSPRSGFEFQTLNPQSQIRNPQSNSRGAALIIAVAILATLFIIGAYFYASSKRELITATNKTNEMRTDFIDEAAKAMAISHIQNDKLLHPTYTSLDSSVFTFFNGGWLAGKPWAFPSNDGIHTWIGVNGKQVPAIDWENIKDLDSQVTVAWNGARNGAGLPDALPIHEALYVPRAQAAPADVSGSFMINYAYNVLDPSVVTPEQTIDSWADVDTDGDGLKDAMWIPVPVEEYFGAIQIDPAPAVTPEGMDKESQDFEKGGDGIDNNLDGRIDEPNETACFVYWGGNDGLDNDGNGTIDDAAEQRLFLTSPLLDSSGNPLMAPFPVLVNQVVLKRFAGLDSSAPDINTTINVDTIANGGSADKIDNDYSMIVNDSRSFVYSGTLLTDPLTHALIQKANNAQDGIKAYNPIDSSYSLADPDTTIVTASGESVCLVGGRVAVHIEDEASKVNVNAAGGLTTDPTTKAVTWTFNEGAGTNEYDTRVVPNWGDVIASNLVRFRNGATDGATNSATFNNTTFDVGQVPTGGTALQYDMASPGYGGVDDNGDALWQMLDGLDNNGNGVVDELWEGIDDPKEFQTFRALRNRIAENDGLDNNNNDVIDEIGELGDRIVQTRDQLIDLNQISDVRLERTRDVLTVHSSDRNQRYQHYKRDDFGSKIEHEFPITNGLKLDFNYALGEDIAKVLKEDWDYTSMVVDLNGLPQNIQDFSEGLRIESETLIGTPWGIGGAWESDPELRAYQIGLNIQDSRDLDSARSQTTITTIDKWWNDPTGANVVTDADGDLQPDDKRQISYTVAGVENIRINELMVRPVRRVEAEADGILHDGDTGYDVNLDPNLFTYKYGLTPDSDPDIPWDFVVQNETMEDSSDEHNPIDPGGVATAVLWRQEGQGYLGPRTVLSTNVRDIVNTTPGVRLDGTAFPSYTNVAQFRFGPSLQLPPGRYYLLVNTRNQDGTPTVTSPDQIEFAVKYARSGDPDILDDLKAFDTSPDPDAGLLVNPNNLFVANDNTGQHGDPRLGINGFVLLPTTATQFDTTTLLTPNGTIADQNRYGNASGNGVGYGLNEAYAITIPDYKENPADQVYLYVAVRIGAGTPQGPDQTLALNFFDFSQEPDHEWVEVTNIAESGDPVDMSGWDLVVGPDPNSEGSRRLRIPGEPGSVKIAPGGSLLLVINKYDTGADNFAASSTFHIFNNGIGMVHTIGGNFPNITEPPIPGYVPNTFLSGVVQAQTGALAPVGTTIGESVFRRATDTDMIDRDGDGISDTGTRADDDVISTNEDPRIAFGTASFEPAKRAFDRIVQLEFTAGDFLSKTGGTKSDRLDNIASLVLGGGVFPNYPEEDGIDNDGDNSVLSNDGIDNNGDGQVDEPNEGIDEGAFRLAHRYDATNVSGDPAVPSEPTVPAGSYSSGSMEFRIQPPAEASPPRLLSDDYITSQNAFATAGAWKEFVERRMFPGDCVIVTLYEGSADSGRIADRVTYTQRDVENASIDDGKPCPYKDLLGNYVTLDGDTVDLADGTVDGDTLWPDNTMGVDFYRTLERKDPLYTGDRFGTTNRWEATDGNYDDWSPGTNRWVFQANEMSGGKFFSRLNTDPNADGTSGIPNPWILFGHGFCGSPLRMNFEARVLENFNADDSFFGRQFTPANSDITTVVPIDAYNPDADSHLWTFRRALIRNRNYASPGDLLTVPHMTLVKNFDDPYQDSTGFESLKPRGHNLGVDFQGSGVLLGQDFPRDLRAVLDSATTDSLILTAGQADFFPLFPTPAQVTATPTLTQWQSDAGPPKVYTEGPRAWSPVYMFNLGDAPALDPVMFDAAPLPSGLALSDLLARWPKEKRATMYVSVNPDTFDPQATNREDELPGPDLNPNLPGPTNLLDSAGRLGRGDPSEALFVWDGDDGLQDGEYDVYIATLDDLRGIVNPSSDLGSQADPFALDLASRAVEPDKTAVDIEVYTDTNADHRCWLDGAGYPIVGGEPNPTLGAPDTSELGKLANPLTQEPEGFGLQVGRKASTDGIIHYGVVKVQNNYLALFIRNWGEPHHVNRFSRVILTPHEKTLGRINVNTVTARQVKTNTTPAPFNPLVGLPGILGAFAEDPATGIFAFAPRPFADTDVVAPGDARLVSPQVLSNAIVAERGKQNYTDIELPGTPIAVERYDGRYYLTPSELVLRGDNLPTGLAGAEQLPPVLYDPTNPLTTQPWTQFDEMKARFSHMAAEITSRSDVFQITVIAQSGQGHDVSGGPGNKRDGKINWRDDTEFEVTGERKTRTVYER